MDVVDQSDAAEQATPTRTIHKLALTLLLFGGIAYCNSLTKSYLLDDVLWITNTDLIRDPWAYVAAMQTRPLFALSLHLNYRFHELNVFGFHLVNIAIHMLASVVLFGLVRRTLLLPYFAGRYATTAHWYAFAIALMWTVHPLQTQAITYIIQRCESMMGMFYLLTFYCMVRGTQATTPWPWYVTSWLCAVLGAGSKEVMVTAIPLLLGYDRIFISDWREIVRRRWWYYLGIVAAIASIQAWGSITSLMQASPESPFGFNLPHLQAPVYWMTQAGVLLYYLRLCFFPYPQLFSYRAWTPTTEFADFWLAGLILAFLFIGVFWLSWRRHAIGFLGLWFFGILSITSIIPLLDVAFEHRLYLPLAAICTLVVIGGEWLCRRVIQLPIAGKVAILGYCIVVTVLTVLTIRRNEDYQSVESMWRSVLAVYPGNDEALNNLAVGLEAAQKFEEAIEVFKQCPDDAPAMATYGILLCRQDRPKEGLYYMRAALGNIEQEYGAPEKRAGKHYDLGKVLFILDDRKSAEHHFARAIAIAPLRPQSYFAMGVLMNQQGRHDEAAKFFAQGLKLDEKNPDSRTRSARYFLHNYPQPSAWTRKEALFFARQAAQSTSYKDLQSLEILVEALAANGKFTEAADVVRQALQSLPAADYERFRAASHRMLAFHQREAAANKK